MSEANNCLNCEYWVCRKNHKKPDKTKGVCRRFPPTLYPKLGGRTNEPREFPITKGSTWCGEWKHEPENKG